MFVFCQLLMRLGTAWPTNAHVYNPSNILARARLVSTCHVTEYSPAKTGEYPSDIPQFSKLRALRKRFEEE